MSRPIPTRLVVCVDGTWFGPDGRDDAPSGNTSNIFRIWAVVKDGLVTDDAGRQYKQVKKYYHGIGVGEKTAGWLNNGISGAECPTQIKKIYQDCCASLNGPDDELWLYGFSRGAYVVRAVAGIFHHLGALTNFGNQKEFDEKYTGAVDKLYTIVKAGSKQRGGELYKHFASSVRDPPKLQFVGVFDTVKALNDRSLHDISFTNSINHLRHAVSLNENLPYFNAELLFPKSDPNTSVPHRSMIQAWFIGAHGDIGGGTKHDGLSLYPLQWMLIESKQCGLITEFRKLKNHDNLIQNPLELIFPEIDNTSLHGEHHSQSNSDIEFNDGPWHFTYRGGIRVEMQDLRRTHHHMDRPLKSKSSIGHFLKRKKPALKESTSSYHIYLNMANPFFFNPRKPFRKHKLSGYNEDIAYGTIIHPSVYFIFDVYHRIYSSSRILRFREDIERFRLAAFSEDQKFPWVKDSPVLESDVKAFRILVCGKTGVGKSTLINRVFGVKNLTQESDLKQGVHDIARAFESDKHPGLLIHDSCGFQAGNAREVKKVREFLRARSGKADVTKRIHAIWFCVQTDANRIIEDADRQLFDAVSECADTVPILLVGTKTDKFLDEHETKLRKHMQKSPPKHVDADAGAIDKEIMTRTQELLSERQKDVEAELREIHPTAWDAVAYVAKDDEDSIKDLLNKTLGCLDNERVRLFCVAAQVCDIDSKVDNAITETLRLCLHAIRTSAAPVPFSALASTPFVSRLICEASLRCFGFPEVLSDDMDRIMRRIVWSNMSPAFYVTIGVMSIAMVPAVGFCILAMPPTARVVVSCACDIILILERAFLINADAKYVGAPEVDASARDHKPRMPAIHQQVDQVIPLSAIDVSVRFSKLRVGMQDIINEHRVKKADVKNLLTDSDED